ncbi:SDR family oxidoreductase [Reyranella sp.]|uniref:SDR family oxidoreductase n=1 Tax=Reyranella sp. TaxID=1929291 RepID=UPI003BA935B0
MSILSTSARRPAGRRSFDGKVVVVTGASAGVGRATARQFARTGAAVALIARDVGALEDAAAEVEAAGGQALAVSCDVADAEALDAAADRIEQELGPIDVWVNCAMLTVFSPLWEMTPQEFRRVTEVTYLGFVYGTMAALARMKPRDRGVVIQVGSSLAYRGIPLQSAYCGAKHAIRGFTDSLRSELIHDGSAVRLVMVQLPAMNTPQFDWARTHMPREPRPVAPVIQPEVAARAIVRAARGPHRELWLGLSTVKVILGSMIAPAFLDRYLARRAFDGQERRTGVGPQRKDNLMAPVSSLHAVHGAFGAEARRSALLVSGGGARVAAAAGLAVAAVAAGMAVRLIQDGRATGSRRALARRR